MSGRMTPPAKGVKVRMYRQGLGDCFLLAFPAEDGAFYMLVDCGVILGTQHVDVIMPRLAAEIKEATGGTIHLLVATHEHWDHLSGFLQARSAFQEIEVKNLWFAWTEDPTNALANRLRAERQKTAAALRMALERSSNPTALDHVRPLLEFFGEPLGVAGGNNTGAALDFLRSHCPAPRYCRPGEAPISLPGVAGVRIYVLGPPENEAKIKQSDPTARGREVYDNAPAMNAATAFLMAAAYGLTDGSQLAPDDAAVFERSFPFDGRYRIPPEQAREAEFFRRYYGFDGPADAGASHVPTAEPQDEVGPMWRRIDDDWLGVSGELALQLDSDTNNTSLALAIELVESGKVLLFPGDAQVGNWLSWHDLSWKRDGADEKAPPITAAELLARTVLYKVGHHASHNATLREKGLMLMTNPDLVAMVPVNHEMAVKKRWNMPFPPLRAALEERTRGRLMLVDEGVPLMNPAAPSPRLTSEERDAFLRQASCQESSSESGTIGYVEYMVTA